MSGEMVSILMVVYKNQHCTGCNPAGLTTCAQKKKHYTLGKIHDHGIHAQHLLIIYVIADVNNNSTFYSCLVTRSVQYGHILVVYDQYLSQVTHILQCSRSNVALGLCSKVIPVILLKI